MFIPAKLLLCPYIADQRTESCRGRAVQPEEKQGEWRQLSLDNMFNILDFTANCEFPVYFILYVFLSVESLHPAEEQ